MQSRPLLAALVSAPVNALAGPLLPAFGALQRGGRGRQGVFAIDAATGRTPWVALRADSGAGTEAMRLLVKAWA